MAGFIKYMRTEEADFLSGKPMANHLMTVIAMRARRTDHPINGLKAGQCFLGDYSSIGMTRQQYRTALDNLVKWQLITIKTTNKGTIATLINTKVYDINGDAPNHQDTIKQPAANQQVTTNKECKKEIMEETTSLVPAKPKPKSKFKFDDDDMKCAVWMFDRVKVINPSAKQPNLDSWANTIRLMRTVNKYDLKQIGETFDWANRDSFWCSNILSPDKLRKQWDKLNAKRLSNERHESGFSQQGSKPTKDEQYNNELLAKYGHTATPSGQHNSQPFNTGLDQHQVSGGVQQQMGQEGFTIDLDPGDFNSNY